jgi:hypothetical protein
MSSEDATVIERTMLNVLQNDMRDRDLHWETVVKSLQATEVDLANEVAKLKDVNSRDEERLQEERERNKSTQKCLELRLEHQAQEIAKHGVKVKDLESQFEIRMCESNSAHKEQVKTMKCELASRSTQHVNFLQATSADIAELESKLTLQGLEHEKALQEIIIANSKSKEDVEVQLGHHTKAIDRCESQRDHALKRVLELEVLVASMAATNSLSGKDKSQQRSHGRTEIASTVSHERLVSNVIDCMNFL